MSDSIKWAISYFIEKYPRFKGSAEICTVQCEDRGNGMFSMDYKTIDCFDSFQSTKELKEYTRG